MDINDVYSAFYDQVVSNFEYKQSISMMSNFYRTPSTFMSLIVIGFLHGKLVDDATIEALFSNRKISKAFINSMHYYNLEQYLPEEYQEIKI